ncbi:hypothetical protein T05_12435 [Trichinella murrelli]|uniref:Uncharacterized protein n=1 Tax=Trichinella murrelli TaxID=144512 RepID=A0A0V0SUJ6_9BILA|nr:hypothetical protein T05_12435 [Trichinella murrelli]
MLFTAAVSQQNIARVALKSVLRALNKLLKNELEHNTKNKGLK